MAGYHFPGVADHAGDAGIVVAGVVMKEEEPLGTGSQGGADAVLVTTVAPADVGLVFGFVVLGVEDKHIHVAQELHELLVFRPAVVERFLTLVAAGPRVQAHAGVGFVVREEGDRAGAGVQPVAYADARVIGEDGAGTDGTDVECHFTLLDEADVGGKLAQADGEVAAFHLDG
ncbi:MAG: hypothetical protein EBS84_19970 [Proteobacteria bacterium]|nr:hypothetical protein [Verrucomicrobiota bacterium]NBU11259.1 hypothetical protein [Pseudomonadota bacterium]